MNKTQVINKKPKTREVKITSDNLLIAMKLSNMMRFQAQHNAAISKLNGEAKACQVRIESFESGIEAEKRTQESLASQAQHNVILAKEKIKKRDKLLEEHFGVEGMESVMSLNIEMDMNEEQLEKHGDDTVGLLLILEDSAVKKKEADKNRQKENKPDDKNEPETGKKEDTKKLQAVTDKKLKPDIQDSQSVEENKNGNS